MIKERTRGDSNFSTQCLEAPVDQERQSEKQIEHEFLQGSRHGMIYEDAACCSAHGTGDSTVAQPLQLH